MIRKFFALKWVESFIKRYTVRLYCRIYGHTYLITYSNKAKSNMMHHRCYCYHCREIYGDLNFPMYLYAVKSSINPQYRDAVEKWLNDIGISDVEVEKLIRNLQSNRVAHMSKAKVNNVKNIAPIGVK